MTPGRLKSAVLVLLAVAPAAALAGGKAQAPLAVRHDVQEVLAPGRDVEVRIAVEALLDCDEVKTEIRGVDGVAVRGGEAREHGRLTAGRSSERPVRLWVPPGRAGYAVVTATCTSNGRARVVVRAIPVRAKGTDASAFRREKLGELGRRPDGAPVVIMKSQPLR